MPINYLDCVIPKLFAELQIIFCAIQSTFKIRSSVTSRDLIIAQFAIFNGHINQADKAILSLTLNFTENDLKEFNEASTICLNAIDHSPSERYVYILYGRIFRSFSDRKYQARSTRVKK